MKILVLLICCLSLLNLQPAYAKEPQTEIKGTTPLGDIHLKVGLGLYCEKKYEAASNSLRLALKQSPKSVKYQFYLSRCLHQLAMEHFYKSDYSTALTLFEEALKLESCDPNTKYALRKTLEKLNLKESKVEKEIETAKEKDIAERQARTPCVFVRLREAFFNALNRRIRGACYNFTDTDKKAVLSINYNSEKKLASEAILSKSSGDEKFDQAVLDAYKLAMPFRFSDLEDGDYTIVLYFDYKMQNNSLLKTEETIELEKQQAECLALYKKGQSLMLETNYKEAINQFEKCNQCALPAFKLLVNEQLGDCLVLYARTLKNKKAALELFKRANILQPDNIDAQIGIKLNSE